jgi:hypothetical protein
MDRTKEFIVEWERKIPHEMSSFMRDAFSHTLDWLTANPHTAGFKGKKPRPDLDDASEYGIAKHYYRYFETHFYKCQNSLLKASPITFDHLCASWLDQPKLWVLDIGAGTGAGTCALLNLMCDYQRYRWENGYPITTKQIHVIAIDPSKFALDVYTRLLAELRSTLVDQYIQVSLHQIVDEFPKESCLERIVAEWSLDNPITLLVLASNVIRPLQNSWDRLKSLFSIGGKQLDLELGDVLARAYEYLLERLFFRRVIQINIVTRMKTKGEWLFDILQKIVRSFLLIFQNKSTYEWWSNQENQAITFVNSPNTFHADQGQTNPVTSEYSHSITIGAKSANADESYWDDIQHEENLKLAHARTRNYIYYGDFIDEVELKLADYFWPDFGDRLGMLSECGDYSVLGVRNSVYYAFPKNKEEDRPKYYQHIGEQLISAAISQTKGSCFKPYKDDRILGNILNQEPTEFFYERWNRHFNNYKHAIRSVAQSGLMVAKVDIRSFYTNINQPALYQLLRTSLGVNNSSIVASVLREIIIRNLINPPHEPNIGLPQSGITAGLWSSRYLKSVDQDVIPVLDGGNYFRYADDITIIDNPSKIDGDIDIITHALDKQLLKLNQNKTKRYEADHYKRLTVVDRRFRDIGKMVRTILEGLYFVPSEYLQAWKADRDAFLNIYSKSLRGLNIYFNPFWLNRQLKTRDSIRHKLVHAFSGSHVDFPSLAISGGDWVDQFTRNNPDWIKLRDGAITQLVKFFQDEYEKYISPSSSDDIKRTSRSAIRFSVYRLSVLGISPIVDDLITILVEKPDLLIPQIALKALVDCGRVDDLLNLAIQWYEREIPENNLGSTMECGKYLSASACWALGLTNSSEKIVEYLLRVLLLPKSDITERLMASEALIRLQVPIGNHLQGLKQLMEQYQDSPFLTKNLVILAASGDSPFQEILPTLPIRKEDMIVRDAIQFVFTDKRNILSIPEPREIERFYAKWYPDLPSELHRKNSSSGS